MGIAEHDPEWPEGFRALRDRIWPLVSDVAISMEHVGSTSVPGLAAKPIIDLDIVIPSRKELPLIVARLARLGYVHRGNLGIDDRDAFAVPEGQLEHNLYVCPRDSTALRDHIVLRDHLRANPSDAAQYADLKRQLAARFSHDIGGYVEGKTAFILSTLARCGFSTEQLALIRNANRADCHRAKAL